MVVAVRTEQNPRTYAKNGTIMRPHRKRSGGAVTPRSMTPEGRVPMRSKVTIHRNCEVCNKPFTTKPHLVRIGKGRFCSKSCAVKAQYGSFEDRLWARIHKTSTCWIWVGGKNDGGYGIVRVNGRDERAHRYMYEWANGPIPPDLYVCHRCDNRACVNPDHLFLGTHEDNMKDMRAKGREARERKLPQTKLLDSDVLEIKRRYAAGGISQTELAYEYGVSVTLICAVVRGRHRPNVE